MDALLSTLCSYFVDKKALFGGFPSQEDVKILEANGVRYFVDLTNHAETNIVPYTTAYSYFNFPIPDHGIPDDIPGWCMLILELKELITDLDNRQQVYVHCKGGHGRCGLVVANLLCLIENLTPSESIQKTTFYHNKRVHMKTKWKHKGSPQTQLQIRFIENLFKPFYIHNNHPLFFNSPKTTNIVDVGIVEEMASDLTCKLISSKLILKEALLNTGFRLLLGPGNIGTIWMKVRRNIRLYIYETRPRLLQSKCL